jgi:hypothetical protein
VSAGFRTPAARAAVASTGWLPFAGGEITAEPLVDPETGLYARLTHVDARAAAERLGGRLLTLAEIHLLHENAGATVLEPITLWAPGRDITERRWAEEHDRRLREQLAKRHWDGKTPLANAGKPWVGDGELGTLAGWYLNGRYIQQASPAGMDGDPSTKPFHAGGTHADYSSLVQLYREAARDELPTLDVGPLDVPAVSRPVLHRGDKGAAVKDLQRLLGGLTADGDFGPRTESSVRGYQAVHGLTPDGVVGVATWTALLGTPVTILAAALASGPAPACKRALADATAKWPSRSRASDGIMGDAAHQLRPSDHNLGNAVDVTHDPGAGCDGTLLAELALTDDRVTYVIWNRRIKSRARAAEGWRPYTGTNPHTHHVHISIDAAKRVDARPWPWAP